ncbi:MAG: 2-isopropylmalate synthase [Lachnospiraceae bacterium]|nr:2-isopropylmalate synthase [Lachnospiraceae bacterium]
MKPSEKYQKQYFMPPVVTYDWVKKDAIDKAPLWCSVDLRDGNQALVEPMSLDEKVEFFKLLVDVGFKEIEIGFPAASETEYQFCRTLIERNLIPEDVTIQVLTQAREHIIKKTFAALKGAPHAVVHVYNSTSVAQREQVFKKSKEEIRKIAVDGATLLKELAEKTEGNFTFEYSPESFTGTEMDYALEVCNAVLDVWKPTPDNKAIINLPATVETAMPHVFACQVEYMSKNMKYRDGVVLSLHPHNDRGCGVSDAELGLLAGADRIEGTLFGNGERTGNVDIITLAMNMFSHGVDPELNLTDMKHLVEVYERVTGMVVHDRQPYAGKLVFTAFSGSHQDAIAKGIAWREAGKSSMWNVPYLPIDPKDVGRTYDSDVIRINSQSGKGGVSYILKTNFGLSLPENMREEVGYTVKDVSDKEHKELTPAVVYQIFEDNYINPKNVFQVIECHFKQENGIVANATLHHCEHNQVVTGTGNGRLDAVSNAIKSYFNVSYELSFYEEHSLTKGSSSKAVAYVGVVSNGRRYWGVGIDNDIIKASIEALAVAVNKVEEIQNAQFARDKRMVEIMNYIQANYLNVTLESLSDKFYLSKPYLSKYIKEKSGMTFGELVKKVRLKKAKTLLKSSSMTVESIALSVGYQNVEHFNRLFKKAFQMTPVQYRNQK